MTCLIDSHIWVRQVGGRYGAFVCPYCGHHSASWKFTQSSGFCDSCDSIFIAAELNSIINREGTSRIYVEIQPNMDDSAAPREHIQLLSEKVEKAIFDKGVPKEAQRHYFQLLATSALSSLSTMLKEDEMRTFLEDSIMVLVDSR